MKKQSLWLALSLLLALMLVLPGLVRAEGPGGAGIRELLPEDALTQAWERARDAGSYRFLSTADQTLIPLPIPEMIGQRDLRLTIENDGAVVLPDRAYIEMRLAGSGQQQSVTLLRDGSEAFMLRDGELTPVEDALSLATPTNDILGYLSAAEQVTLLPSPEGRPDLTRYGFQISGARFEEYVRREAEAELASEPGAPAGLKLQETPALQAISGQGELWVNADGLPVRQVLDLDMPEASASYRARVHMVVDLSAYGQVEALPRAVQDAAGMWRVEGDLTTVIGGRDSVTSVDATTKAVALSDPEQAARAEATVSGLSIQARLLNLLPLRVTPTGVALFVLTVLAVVAWRYFRRRAMRYNPRLGYTILAVILIPIMVLGPLLQSGQILAFTERTARAAEARVAGAPELVRALGLETAESQAVDAETTPANKYDEQPFSLDLIDRPGLTTNLAKLLPSRVEAGQSAATLMRCGQGEVGSDTDGDGLTDPIELCYGTSPYNADSDSDGIPDKVELDGFDLDGTHWDSDPLDADSNGDRLLDTFEWSSAHATNGQAASPDIDGDGVPNVWDDDDDGDGVPDGLDVSPQMRSDYTSAIDLSMDGDASVGHTYFEFQVQPQDANHLRYSTTALDWPMDDEGNVHDLDLSTDDLRLTPFLLVETNVRPTAELEAKYGSSSWETDAGYVLLVPLTPLQDGGLIYAFSGKVGYAPGQIIDTSWNAKMVWMAQMQNDAYIQEPGGSYTIAPEMRLLHQYQDTFRLIGLHMTVNQGYEAAVLGTPDETDDLDLFKVMLGLHDTYRSNLRLEGQEPGETALQEIAQRFGVSSTASITHTFGVDAYKVAMSGPTQYAHSDAGMAGVGSDLVPNFLQSYDAFYGNDHCRDAEGNAVSCASLVVAYEQSQGGHDLSDMPVAGSGLVDLSALYVNVTDVPVVTTRGVQMRMYEQGAGGWQVATPARTLELIEQRYQGVYGTAMRDLYPELTVDDVRFIAYSAYLAVISPAYTPVSVDGQALVPEVADEAALALGRALSAEFEGAVETAIDWVALGSGMVSALVGVGGYMIWVGSDFLQFLDEWATTSNLGNAWAGLGVGLFSAATFASIAMGVINAVCGADMDLAICRNEDALFAANLAVNSLAIVAQAQCVASLIISYVQHSLKAISTAALVAQGIGAVVGISLSWACFAMAVVASAGDPVVWRVALAEAIVTTIYLVIVFALNFIPIIGQIITAVLAVIDMLIALFTGLFTDKTYSLATAILNLFYDASTSTVLAAADFGTFETTLTDPEGGLVGGNGFEISLPFSGVITKTSDGTTSDLEDSYVQGVLVEEQGDDFVSADTSQPRDCDVVAGELHCTNTATMRYTLTPHINGIAGFTSRILYQTVWAEYGMYHAWRWATHTEDGALPDWDDAEWSELPLDVIPGDMDDLWGWDALGNNDRDGDGLSNAVEAAMGTDPDLPDTDGDGLSDHYEWMMYEDLGADPTLADTDGDGLNDGLERQIGSKIDVADSDGDGLTDGEEVRRAEAGAMVGGWTVNLSGFGDAWVTSSPLKADDDGDNLTAYEEMTYGLSPRAANDLVPTLSMSVSPIRGLPGGRSGLYLQSGETVVITLQLANGAPDPIDGTLSLRLPDWLGNLEGGAIEGDRTPTATAISASGMRGLSWSFTGADALQTFEFAATTVTATVASLAMGAEGEITLDLPYGSQGLHRSKTAIVDSLSPEVAVLAPPDGAFLNGTSYVVGGTARDATTWLTDVELSIVPRGDGADLHALSGSLSPWAHAWDLPGDGVYTLQARATDAMGNQRTTGDVNVTVDNTAPTATLSASMDGAVVRLSGTATDNLAGIERVQLAIDGQPWRSVTLTGQGTTNATWTYDWPVGIGAQGEHDVRMRALDRAGNASDVDTAEILVDRVAPSSVVNSGAEGDVPPAVKASTTFTLTGVADEGGHLPAPATAADLRTGMDTFADASVWLGVSTIHDNDGGVLAAWIGDFDADRMADLAVGLPGPDGAAGEVAVLYGRAGGWPAAPDLEMLAESRTRFLGEPGVRLGSYVAAAGDANGDSMFDLLIGERDSARAFLVFGYPGPQAGVTLDGGQAGLRTLLQAPANVDGLAGAGDVNGDGRDDLLIRAGATAYLILGRTGPWPETLDVAAEAVASFDGVTGATGVGDVNDDQRAEWVTLSDGSIALYRWDTSSLAAKVVSTTTTADAEPRVAALGDVDGDGLGDWVYSNGASRTLVYASGATPHTFSDYGGVFAAPGDVDGDGRADLLLVDASGVGSFVRQQQDEAPEVFATISGVGGAANAPYAGGADLNADGSAEVVLIPSAAAAQARGFDAPDFSSGFVSPQALPQGVSSAAMEGGEGDAKAGIMAVEGIGISSSTGAETRYVDDDGVCDGYTPCHTTIQLAVNATDGGGDTVIVYPGVYAGFSVPADFKYNNLTVRGVNPDAVFVEGSGGQADAVRVAADGVRLVNLTVRDAVSGIALADGAGEPAAAGGSETTVDHVVAHAVQYPISMTRGSALTVHDSTLVGDGVRPIVQVNASSTVHAWNNDREVGTPVTTTAQPIASSGALLSAGGALYAVPGGVGATVYASTPGAGGALGNWSAPFTLKHDFWQDAPTEGTSMVTAGGSALYQLHTSAHWPKVGGAISVTMSTADAVPFPLPTLVNAVAVHPTTGEVYIGGAFTSIGGQNRFRLARWDGTSWQKVGSSTDINDNGVDGVVYALDFVPDRAGSGYSLYIGGDFDQLHRGDVAANVVRWTGSQWQFLGAAGSVNGYPANGVNGPVYALTHDSSKCVYLGGSFTETYSAAGGPMVSNVARYYEQMSYSPWLALGSGFNGPVHALVATGDSNDYVYAGGAFTASGAVSTNGVARITFDYLSDPWEAAGAGVAGDVVDLARDPVTGDIYGVADSVAAVQRWNGSTWAQVSGVAYPANQPDCVAVDADGNVYVGASYNGAALFVQRVGTTGLVRVGSEGAGKAMSSDWIEDLAVDSGGRVYAATNHWLSTFDTGSQIHYYESHGGLSRWLVNGLYARALPSGSWAQRTYPPTASDYTAAWTAPTAMTGDASGNLYAVWGNYSAGVLYRFDAATNAWAQRANPDATLTLGHLVWANDKLYALGRGSSGNWGLRRYDHATNAWTALAAPPIPTWEAAAGLSWTWDGADCLYMLRGDGTRAFSRYRLSTNAWEALPDPSSSFAVSYGPALARVGSYLYVYGTPSGGATNLFRYGMLPASDLRLTLRGTALVAPEAATSFSWTNLGAAAGDYAFQTSIDASNTWVASSTASWSPARPAGTTTLTAAQAAFVAPVDGLYRVGAGSLLSAGYHAYVAVAHVYPSPAVCLGCADGSLIWGETAFATIREAVESGAARVLVHPGRYPQTFYLVSGVEVVGSGAEVTIIEAPAGTAATLVTAEGVAHATLARVTLAGGAGWQGLIAEGGTQGLTFTRNIVRDLSTGVRVRGGSDVAVINNTIVHNVDGYVAEGTNPVDVRNTILAYNTGTGLLHGAETTSLSSTYNDFFGNGTDMSPAEPGGGSLFYNPSFRALADNDLRLSEDSLLIDRGSPSDPTPPGTGTRADMGYAEYNAAGFYVSGSYSETGLNDGLTWGLDAFSTIANGLGAAAATLAGLQGALPEGGYSVGVDAGTYSERVSVPSHVRLVGSGAEVTTIDAGASGSAVTFDGVSDAAVSGMTLQNAGGAGVELKNAASGITIARNVIRNNAGHGVRLTGRSTAMIASDTLVDNVGAGVYAGDAGTWAEVRNSIFSGGAYGLQAASDGLIRNDYNLLDSTTNLSGVTGGEHTLTGGAAFAATGHYYLTAESPAVDAADPLAAVPPAGGVRADLGYKELTASPLTLFFGPQIDSLVTGNSGVQQVEVGVVSVSDATQPVTATLPTTWETLTTGATDLPLYFWNRTMNQATAGLYRVYSRATDVAGNAEAVEGDWYDGAFVVDDTAPTISWGTPALPASTGAAAVLAVAQVNGTVSTGTGTRDDVKQVYFRVVGPDRTASYPAEAGQAWIPLPVTGSYTIQAFVVDEAGNQAQTNAATVTVSAGSHVASVSTPREGGAVSGTAVTLRGYARFTTAGTSAVSVAVSGGATVQATLEEPGARASAWWATVTLPSGDGAKVVTVTPSIAGASGAATTLNLTLDTTAPTLVVNGPTAGTTVTRTVTFDGTADDASGSGLARVEVSLDGGYTWRQAALAGGAWSLSVEMNGPQDYVSYPARVRAVDVAGNVAVAARVFAVDSEPPAGLTPVSFDQPEGQHLQLGTSLSVEWSAPIDAGGAARVLLDVDQSPTTEPATEVTGTSASVSLAATGEWYVHLATVDAAGNQLVHHYGPWYVRDMTNASLAARRQSIVEDGFIDLEHDEWQAGDLIGTDAQGIETQQLYATWDGLAIYLGWSGAWWTLDGAMWAYLDVASGGSTQTVDGAYTLPMAADVAVRIDGLESGGLYNWTDGAWALSTTEGEFSFAHGSSGDTEARIARGLADGQTVEMVAFALQPAPEQAANMLAAEGGAPSIMAVENSAPWVIFPNTNPLGGELTTPFSWSTPLVSQMNDGQPQARTVLFSALSPQASGVARCEGSTLEYAITLENPEPTAISGLTLTVTPGRGLGYVSVAGASLTSDPTATTWTFGVPEIAAGATQRVSVTAALASDLSGLAVVTTTIALAGETALTGVTSAAIAHRADGQAPSVIIDVPAGSAIAGGAPTFTGAADDGEGSGVERVEVRAVGATDWQTASGTVAWSAALAVPDGATTFALEARAFDVCGHASETVTWQFSVDDTAPQVSWAVPAVITSTVALLGGSTSDPAPAGALVARVQAQVDSDDTAWLAASGPYAPVDGVQGWTWGWAVPLEDGVTHRLRARAVDGVGNTTTTEWSSTTVDVVAPAITVTTQLTEMFAQGDAGQNAALRTPVLESLDPGFSTRIYLPTLQRTGAKRAAAVEESSAGPDMMDETAVVDAIAPVELEIAAPETIRVTSVVTEPILAGTVADGSGVQVVRIWVYGALGSVSVEDALLSGGAWQYLPDLADWEIGTYALRVQAIDIHGNARVSGPYALQVVEQPIAGLAVTSNSPKRVDQTVILTATVDAGSNLVYAWDLGDGSVADGSVVEHAYAAPGTYTAKVTATNSISSTDASTEVVVMPHVVVDAGDDRIVNEGDIVTVTATFVDQSLAATHFATIDWDDGAGPVDGLVDEVASTVTGSHKYPDDGSYAVTVTVRAPDDESSDTLQVTANNVAPTVALSGDDSVNEGAVYTLTLGEVVDPGDDTVTTWTVRWDDGTPDVTLTTADYPATGQMTHIYADGPLSPTIAVDLTDEDGTHTAAGSKAVTVNNVAPEILSASPISQVVQYSDQIAEIRFTAADLEADDLTGSVSWSSDGETFTAGAPGALALSDATCGTTDGVESCDWTLSGAITLPAGVYTLRLAVTDDDGASVSTDVMVEVQREDAEVSIESPVSVPVASDGGVSGRIPLTVCLHEGDDGSLGDISLAQARMTLVPAGPGDTIEGVAGEGTPVDGAFCIPFEVSDVPVNLYTLQVTVEGDYYTGSGEDMLVVYDPSLGFVSGGGWFYWPDTADEGSGYLGDPTNFGYAIKYNKKGTSVQGNLMMIRHLADGTIYRVKATALSSLTLGKNKRVPMGWATISGKCTYLEPGWSEAIGGYKFTVYVEDRDAKGDDSDRFWIAVDGGLSLPQKPVDNAVPIEGGNIVVPH